MSIQEVFCYNDTIAETEAIVKVVSADGREDSIHIAALKGDARLCCTDREQ